MGWTIDFCLASSPDVFHRSLSRIGEELSWAALGPGALGRLGALGALPFSLVLLGCTLCPQKAAPGDCRWDFQIQLVRLLVGAVRGRRLGMVLRGGVPLSAEAICLWNSMKTRGKKLSAFLPRIFVSVVQGENKCV